MTDSQDTVSLDPYIQDVEQIDPLPWSGEVTATVGLLIESRGPAVAIGDFCEIMTDDQRRIRTQVIGFRNGRQEVGRLTIIVLFPGRRDRRAARR